jgi:hypothetical protein
MPPADKENPPEIRSGMSLAEALRDPQANPGCCD